MSRRVIVIAGASCSGKTTLADRWAEETGAAILRLDDYYRPFDHLTFEERCDVNFDHPDSIDQDLVVAHARILIEGGAVQVPDYDFMHHARTAGKHWLRADSHLIIEGLFALVYPELVELADETVFVEASEDVCLDRRIGRDVRERGRTPDEVVHRFRNHVWPMYLQHVLPTRSVASRVIYGDGVADSVHDEARVTV